MNAARNLLGALLVACLWCVAPAGAELIQHLDASVPDSVVLSGDGVVRWNDLSGNGNDATANRGTVLYPSTPFPGGDVGVDCGFERNDLELFDATETSALLDFSGAAAGNSGFTLLVACRVDMVDPSNDQYILGTRNTNGNFMLWFDNNGDITCKVNNNTNSDGELPYAAGDTIVLGVSYEAATGNIWFYESKNDVITTATKPANGDWDAGNPLVLGEAKPTANSSNFFRGAFGEVMVFNEYIDTATAGQYIAELVYQWVTPLAEKVKPGGLVPADESVEQALDTVLRWKPGLNSTGDDVYFGTDADAVANATPDNPLDVYMGTQTETSYALPTLDYGTTYYYRIDSISDATYSSDVISFDTIKYAYPLDSDYITATASSTAGAEGILDPNDTCNRAGLDVNDMHGTGSNTMWLSDPYSADPVWIQYDFDAPVMLSEILIWNYNSVGEQFYGHSVKDATIEYTADGLSWQTLTNVTLTQGPSEGEYAVDPNNRIPVNDLTVKGIRINALSNYSDFLPNMIGLSEVQFLVVPLLAADPVPGNGQANVALTLPELSWTAGRGAVSHALYLSTDEAAVAGETVAPITLQETSYELAALDVNTAYYWKVNENTGAEVWAGNLWSFTTVATVLLDGMEAYTAQDADDPNPIYAVWLDGYEDPSINGALVGADPYAGDGDPFTAGDGDFSPEIIVIRSGLQSLPIWFDNTAAPVSQATRSFAEIPDVGARRMELYYQFGTDSVGDALFVEINGVEVASAAIPATILPVWSEISIDLTSAGIDDATQITSMSIGVRGANAKGVVYVDDVTLTN